MVIFIYNTIHIGMTEKIRQYGMLRCIGMDNRGLLKLLMLEELVYTVFGLAIGCAGGRLLNGIVADKIIQCFMDTGEAAKENLYTYIS